MQQEASSVASNVFFLKDFSDEVQGGAFLPLPKAQAVFQYFLTHPLFRWKDANNDCEDRANAICMLLDGWGIPNYKGWVFSGSYLNKGSGSLINLWNYHVAACLPVKENEQLSFHIIDPSTANTLLSLEAWANAVTDQPFSYYFVKESDYYIFPAGRIEKDNWHRRDRRNYKWTVQGLSGINGVSKTGKAQLCFNKPRIKRTEQKFKELMAAKPLFLDAN